MPEPVHGRSAEAICEGGAGGEYSRALSLLDLENAAYCVENEFCYDETNAAVELVRIVKDLRAHLERLSIDGNAELSLNRTCPACDGDGTDWRLQEPERSQSQCEDCEGTGYVASPRKDQP